MCGRACTPWFQEGAPGVCVAPRQTSLLVTVLRSRSRPAPGPGQLLCIRGDVTLSPIVKVRDHGPDRLRPAWGPRQSSCQMLKACIS
jgi:hypothetical protein